MRQAFSVARLTQREELVDLAISLAQWDILALLHHLTVSNGNGSKAHYFAHGILNYSKSNEVLPKLYQLYEQFVQKVTTAYL